MITPVTGIVRSNGTCILQFTGPANRSVVWSLVSGSGELQAQSWQTDAYGRAFALYKPGGYTGKVVIGVDYGS